MFFAMLKRNIKNFIPLISKKMNFLKKQFNNLCCLLSIHKIVINKKVNWIMILSNSNSYSLPNFFTYSPINEDKYYLLNKFVLLIFKLFNPFNKILIN